MLQKKKLYVEVIQDTDNPKLQESQEGVAGGRGKKWQIWSWNEWISYLIRTT